jgi:hypothetical protein
LTEKPRNFLPFISLLFDLAGIAAIVWGFYLFLPALGFIVAGLGLILLGLAVDPPKRKPQQLEE